MRHFRLLLLCGMLCLVGCGDLLSMKQAKTGLEVLPCRPDPSALSKIFTKDVSKEIGCLGNSLKVFIKTVKTDGQEVCPIPSSMGSSLSTFPTWTLESKKV